MTLEESQEVILFLEDMIGRIEEQQSLMAELYQELEERDKQLLELQEQNQQWQECLELNEKLNCENRSASVQVLQKDLKQTKDSLESVRGKSFRSELTIESLQDKLHASEEAGRFAETHQKVVTVTVEKKVPYEKCRKCHKGLDDTALVGFVRIPCWLLVLLRLSRKYL